MFSWSKVIAISSLFEAVTLFEGRARVESRPPRDHDPVGFADADAPRPAAHTTSTTARQLRGASLSLRRRAPWIAREHPPHP